MVGPSVELNPKATLLFSMSIHELSTNAAKYGALSNDKGKVRVQWSIEGKGQGPEIVFEWIEEGGRIVTPPEKNGYGSSLIKSSIEHGLGGTVERKFSETGVRYKVRVPREKAIATGNSRLEGLPDPFA